MAKWSVDNFIILGAIFTPLWLVMMYGNILPFKPSFDGIMGQLLTAWIVISSLMLGIGILIKIITRKTS